MQQSQHPVVIGFSQDAIPVGLGRHQAGELLRPFVLQRFSARKDEDDILRRELMIPLIRSMRIHGRC